MTTTGRRALLVAGAAAGATALAGCTSSEGRDGPRRPGAAEREAERVARAEAALRARSVTAARGLLERYDAVLGAHPALTSRLAPLRRSVAAHVTALGEGGTGPVKPAAASSPAPGPTSSTSASPAPVPVAADPAAALGELAAAERAAAEGHADALLAAPPEYARLLASVAASGAVHAYLLTEGTRA